MSDQLTRWAGPALSSTNTGTGSELLCLLGTVLVLALALVLFLRHRSTSRRGGELESSNPDPDDPHGTVPTHQLATDANTLLVAADDSLKTSEQELIYATAQYGAEATREFTAALEQSRIDVAAAFHLRQMLDDDVPDDEATQRSWYAQIIERCGAADTRLDAQVEAFDKLRDLEANVETLIPALAARRDIAAFRLPQAQATHLALEQRYAPSAVIAVSDSGAQVQERIDFADRTLDQAAEAMRAGNRPLAALCVRATEDALGQVDLIFESVERLSADLGAALTSVTSALSSVESDIAAGQAAVATAGAGVGANASAGTVDLAAAVAGASQVAQSVRAELTTSKPDPFLALRRLEQVNVRLSTALSNIRDAASRAERARTMLEQAIPAAQAEISAVTNFITTRRGAVGSDARTRLNEAERHLAQALALASADPVAALTAAQQADALAEQAGKLANSDVNDWSQPSPGSGVGGISMGGLGGAVLGGILLEGMLDGGRGRGRGGRGGGMGGLGGGFGWGGRIPGSYGGPGTRVRVRF